MILPNGHGGPGGDFKPPTPYEQEVIARLAAIQLMTEAQMRLAFGQTPIEVCDILNLQVPGFNVPLNVPVAPPDPPQS